MTSSRIQHVGSTTVLVLLSLCAACTTMRPVPVDATGGEIRSQIHTGDTVQVFTQDRRSETLHVTAVGETALAGVADGARIEIPYQTMQTLEVRRVSGAKTAGLIVGAVAAMVTGATVAHDDQHLSGHYSF